MIKKIILMIVVFLMLVGTIPVQAKESEVIGVPGDSLTPPTNRAQITEPVTTYAKNLTKYPDKNILLIEDNYPWDSQANGTVLSKIAPYTRVSTSEVSKIKLNDYDVIVFANDQTFATYTKYAELRDKMEEYVVSGGVLIFGACDDGWSDGRLVEDLPGGVTKKNVFDHYNYIEDSLHPIVTGVLTDGKILTDAQLYHNYCSHISFNEASLPVGTKVLFKNSNNEPTLIEYQMGKGTVIASGLTWEHSYVYGRQNGKGLYSEIAYEDLFVYGLYVRNGRKMITSNITYTIPSEKVGVFIGDYKERNGIKGAVVTINGKSVVSDEYGVALFSLDDGNYNVEITKGNFYTKEKTVSLKQGNMTVIYMTQKGSNDVPYIESAILKKNEQKVDILTNRIYFTEDEETEVSYELSSEVLDKKFSKYLLYQGTNIIELTSKTGKIKPGQLFDPEKPIYLQLVCEDGTKSTSYKTGIFIKEKSSGFLVYDKNANEKYSLGYGVSVTVPGSVPIIGGTELEYSISDLPVTIEVENNKVKIAIGITDFKSEEKAWDDYIKKIDEASKTAERLTSLKEICKKFGAKSGGFTLQKGFEKPDFQFIGYAEGTWENGQITSITGKFLAGVDFEYTYNQQFIVGPVPVYFEIGAGAELELNAEISKILMETGEIQLNVPITFKPHFSIGAGAGINGALSVGAEGEVTVPVTWDIKNKYLKVMATGSAKLTASLLFVFNAEHEIAKGTWNIYENYYGKKVSQNMSSGGKKDELDVNDYGVYSLIDTSYRENTSEWRVNRNRTTRSISLTYEEILQAYILPGSRPQIVSAGGKTVLVFQADNGSENITNAISLMYSVLGDDGFSIPKPVWENNGEADFYAQLIASGDEIYLVWQKANSRNENQFKENVNLGETDIISLTQKMEIAFAKFNADTNSFTEQIYVTDNNCYDGSAVVASKGNGLYSVVWVRNESSDILSTGTTNKIMHSIVGNDKVHSTETLLTTDDYILSIDASYINDKLYVAYNSDKDGNLNTADDVEIFLYNNGKIEDITSDNLSNTNPQISQGTLYWYENGIIKGYDLTENDTCIIGEGTDNYYVLETGDNVEVVYNRVGEDGKNTIYSYKVVNENNQDSTLWIANVIGSMNSFSVVKDIEGNYHFVYGITDFEDKSNYKLLYLKSGNVNDLELYNVSASDLDYTDGIQHAVLTLRNNGVSSVDGFDVEVFESGEFSDTLYIDETIEPGEEKKIEITFDRYNTSKVSEYGFNVVNNRDANTENNQFNVTLGYNDVAMKIDEVHINNYVEIFAELTNLTERNTDVEIKVYEDSLNGEVVFSRQFSDLRKGNTQVVSFTLDRGRMSITPGKDKVYVIVATSEDEVSTGDNQYSLLIPTLEQEVTNVKIGDGETIKVIEYGENKGKQKTLSVKTYPENVTTKVQWKSSNSKVVTVNSKGVMTVKGIGNAVITAYVDDNTKTELLVRVVDFDNTAPTNVKVTSSTGDGVALKWNKLKTINNYEVYRATSKSGKYTMLGRTANNVYTDVNVEVGKTYYYKVRGYVNYDGEYFYTKYCSALSAKFQLEKPSINVSQVSLEGVQVSWNSVSKADSYKVYRATSKNGTYKLISTLSQNYYIDNNVSINKTYYYRVRAVKGDYQGILSSPKSIKTVVIAPSYVSVSQANYNTVQICVSTVSNATGYEVYRTNSEKGTYKKITRSKSNYIYDTNLEKGKAYYYKARIYYQKNKKTYYSAFTAVTKYDNILNSPSWKQVVAAGEKQNFLEWYEVKGATGYEILTSDSAYGTYKKLATVTNTKYVHKNLNSGKTYYYKVKAYYKSGNKKVYSSESYYHNSKPAFAPPYDAKVTFNGTYNKLSFSKSQGASGVEISGSTSYYGDYKVLINTKESSYKHKGILLGNYYYYKLRSYRTVNGVKEYSDYVNISIYTTVPQVQNLSVKNVSGTSLELTWDKKSWVDGYAVYRRDSYDSSFQLIATVKGGKNASYTDKGLTPGNVYCYAVCARVNLDEDNYIYGYLSDYIYMSPKVPKVDASVSATYNSISVKWDKVKSATGYEVYRCTKKAGTYKKIKTITKGSVLSYKDTDVSYNKSYYYKVRAYTTKGNVKYYGSYSDVVNKKVQVQAVKSMTLQLKSYNKVKVSWKKASGATGYYVYYKKSNASSYKSYKTTKDTSVTIGGLSTKTKYDIKIVPYRIVKNKKIKSTKTTKKSIKTLSKS